MPLLSVSRNVASQWTAGRETGFETERRYEGKPAVKLSAVAPGAMVP
jgi:hypothetical protein